MIMRTPSLAAVVTLIPLALLICPVVLAQDKSSTAPGLSQRSNISEVMDWLDKNGLAQARVGVRTSSRPVRKESGVLQEDASPAVSLFYSEGFKFIQIENCGVLLRNDNTKLLAHSKLAPDPPPDQRYRAELYIPLNRLSLKKGKGPYRHTPNPDKAHLLGTWRTEFKSNRSEEDVVLTLFAPGKSEQLGVWEAETLTFTFESKETSQKFTDAFHQAIKICQPVKYLIR